MDAAKTDILIGIGEFGSEGVLAALRRIRDGANEAGIDAQRSFHLATGSLDAFESAAAGLVSVAALGALTRTLVSAGLAAERLNAQFVAIAGANAGRELAFARETAERLGLAVSETAQSYARFLVAVRGTSLEGEPARRIFEALGMSMTALRLPVEQQSRAWVQLGQMLSKGRINQEDMKVLAESLPGVYQALAQSLGLTTGELLKQMEAGTAMTSEVLPKLATWLEKTYGPAAAEGAASTSASVNRLKNSLTELSQGLGTALMPTFQTIVDFLRSHVVPTIKAVFGGIAMGALGTSVWWQKFKVLGGMPVKGTGSEDWKKEWVARTAWIDTYLESERAKIVASFDPIGAGQTIGAASGSGKTSAELAAEAAVNAERARKERADANKAAAEKAAKDAAKADDARTAERIDNAKNEQAWIDAVAKSQKERDDEAVRGAKGVTDAWQAQAADRDRVQSDSIQAEIDLEKERADEAIKGAEAVSDAWQAQAADRYRVQSDALQAEIDLEQERADEAVKSADGVSDTWIAADRERVEAYSRALDLLSEQDVDFFFSSLSDRMVRFQEDFAVSGRTWAEGIGNSMESAMGSLENYLVKAFTTGKMGATEMVNSILADFARLTIQQSITRPLFDALSLSVYNWNATSSTEGGGVNTGIPAGWSGEVPSSAPRRAVGRQAQGAQSQGVVVNVINHTGAAVQTQERTGLSGEKITDIIVGTAATDVLRGGSLAQAMQTVFGLSRRGRL